MLSYYGRPGDDVCQSLPPTVTSGTADPDYPAANLISEDPASPAKLTGPSGNWVLEFPSPVAPVAAILVYQYLDEALPDVSMQGEDSNSWGSPAVDVDFTIPAKRLDGPPYQRWTVSPIVMLPGEAHNWWRLNIGSANSQNVHIGRLILLTDLRQVTLFADPDVPEDDEFAGIVQPTALKVETVINIEGPRRGLSAALIGTDLAAGTAPVQEAADFRKLIQETAGKLHSFPLIPFVDFAPNDAWLVKFESTKAERIHRVGGHQRWSFTVREVSRGLPFP